MIVDENKLNQESDLHLSNINKIVEMTTDRKGRKPPVKEIADWYIKKIL